MELMFIGADHEVTGSCHFLQVGKKKFLVDCGMEQGIDRYENAELPVPASEIDFVFLTHAHIDHSGMLPKLYHDGFRGQILSTKATASLCDIMQWRNKKAKRKVDGEGYEPIYTMEDAMETIKLFVSYPYDKIFSACEGVRFRFTDVGHLLGSASIELWLEEGNTQKKIVFSGDLGNKSQPLLKDPELTAEADYVVMESTYGDRIHEKDDIDVVEDLAEVISETFHRGGNVVIPAFAVGRTQVILYYIRQIKENNLVPDFPGFPVYVDSPLAVDATEIFYECGNECYDQEALDLLAKGINPISFPNLQLTITTEESKAINEDTVPKVIISASGMCDAGRIKHHLKYNLWREDSTILMVGYQSQGSPGRRIQDGAKEIKLFGEDVAVRARIYTLPGLSGHADTGWAFWSGSRDSSTNRDRSLSYTEKTRWQSCLRRRSAKNAGSGLRRLSAARAMIWRQASSYRSRRESRSARRLPEGLFPTPLPSSSLPREWYWILSTSARDFPIRTWSASLVRNIRDNN